jgi:Tfp pilus assembly protein FimT
LSGGNNLSTGGRVVANLLTVARSEAINRRAPIRFQVATTWPSDSSQAYRKITLVQHDPSTNTDTQITEWQTVPKGASIHPSNSAKYFFSVAQAQNPKLTLGGQQITSSYLEFTPTGAPNVNPASAPVTCLVVPTYNTSKTPAQIVGVAGMDYYAIDVDALVGKPLVRRP